MSILRDRQTGKTDNNLQSDKTDRRSFSSLYDAYTKSQLKVGMIRLHIISSPARPQVGVHIN